MSRKNYGKYPIFNLGTDGLGRLVQHIDGKFWNGFGFEIDFINQSQVTGPIGPQGIQGSTGSQGLKGESGSTGPNGPMDVLTDVTYPIGGPSDGDILKYNSAIGQWEPVSSLVIEFFLNFEVAGSFDYVVPYDLQFESFATSVAMATTFVVSASSYTFGTPLDQYDVLTVTTDVAGLITLEGVRI